MPLLALGTGYDRPSPRGLSLADMIRHGFAIGYKHIETAEVYPKFATIGPVLLEFPRESFFLTTKIDPTIGVRRRQCADSGEGCFQVVVDATKDLIQRKLRQTHVDLLMLHRPPARSSGGFAAQCTKLREQWRALEHIKRELKLAKAIGTSNMCVELMRCLLQTAREPPSVMSQMHRVGMGTDPCTSTRLPESLQPPPFAAAPLKIQRSSPACGQTASSAGRANSASRTWRIPSWAELTAPSVR